MFYRCCPQGIHILVVEIRDFFQISKIQNESYEDDLTERNKLYKSHNHIYPNISENAGRGIVYLSIVLSSIVSILKHKYITAYS